MSDQGITFGVVTGQHQLTWDQIRDQWKLAESFGFDSLWLFDHFTGLYADPAGPCLEASTLLAGLALETERAEIGVLVYGNTHRSPVLLAKEIVTVDHLSGGRAILGIGTGWNENEHRWYGIPLPTPGTRVKMLDESLTVIQGLFDNERFSFDGEFYHIEDAPFAPKPVGRMPILVGGKKPRMLRVVAKHADVWDSSGPPEVRKERVEELKRACDEVGREYGEIRHSMSFGADKLMDIDRFEDLVRTYAATGVQQFLFDFPLDDHGQALAKRVATELIPRLKDELDGSV
ncbi:MAG TPA: LLM class flavin-dependent oxidoreductase [Thermomicrobiales bacterium]|nr:LLM class flavin-dependent oxidoreductase [Thermomicrobiales bacterium]